MIERSSKQYFGHFEMLPLNLCRYCIRPVVNNTAQGPATASSSYVAEAPTRQPIYFTGSDDRGLGRVVRALCYGSEGRQFVSSIDQSAAEKLFCLSSSKMDFCFKSGKGNLREGKERMESVIHMLFPEYFEPLPHIAFTATSIDKPVHLLSTASQAHVFLKASLRAL